MSSSPVNLHDFMVECLVAGASLPAEVEPSLARLSINHLRALLYQTLSRDKVWFLPDHLVRDFREHLFRLGYDPRRAEVRVSEFMCRRLSNLPTVPAATVVLHHSRLQFARLIAELSPQLQQKMRHVWQVQLCHNLTKHALLGRGAVTYVANGVDPLPGHLYPLDSIQVCNMSWHKSAGAAYVSTMLAVNSLQLNPDYQLLVEPGQLLDMSFVPLDVPVELAPFYGTAIDMHAVAEMSLAQGRSGQKQAPLPNLWACFTSADDLLDCIASTSVTGALGSHLCQKLNKFVDLAQDGPVTRLPADCRHPMLYPAAAEALLRLFTRASSQLCPTNDPAAAFAMLCRGKEDRDFLINTLIMGATVALDDNTFAFPLAFLTASAGKEPVRVLAEFAPLQFCGREVYGRQQPGGPIRYWTDHSRAAVHVVGG